jgi:His-Xaa-Ser system radical SAM maturase HxsC
MAQKLTFRGVCHGLPRRTLARLSFTSVPEFDRDNYFLVLTKNTDLRLVENLNGYAAVLVEKGAETKIPKEFSGPIVIYDSNLSSISCDSILAINPDGHTRIMFRPESTNNTIFATVECNSNCLMCSQPPALSKDDKIVEEHLRLIDLIKEPPDSMGITGGEPTLLKDGLIAILSRLKERFPNTIVHMLTNGRLYAYEDLVAGIANVGHPHFTSAIPLYSDIASEHDYVVQAPGAFDETLVGLYNAARHGLRIEIRVVLHKQTLPRLKRLADFIYRNLPFVDHVALMGLENMGYVRANWSLLWEDPLDYSPILEDTVRYLFYRRMNVSVYNLQLCVLPRTLWGFARQSISDFKNIYLDECSRCDVKDRCAGLFLSSETRHSRGIKAIHLEDPTPQLASQLSCAI